MGEGRGGLASGRDTSIVQQPMFSNPLLGGTLRWAVCRVTAGIPLRPNKFRHAIPRILEVVWHNLFAVWYGQRTTGCRQASRLQL